MNGFPAVDPIPLPAPVWLFKALHMLTLSLHFVAVEMLLGGLLVAVCLSFAGGKAGAPEKAAPRRRAAGAMARRLPLVMTYVINLAIPPLLFAQVLYGRALYTSSVLIGIYWIAVVFLLMGCYWLLYRFSARAQAGEGGGWLGLGALVLAGVISRILATNMTLMLRPEVWPKLYAASGIGLHLPADDPTLLPRWLFMLAGGLVIAGLWMVSLAGRQSLESTVRRYLAGTGGRLALLMILVQAFFAYQVFRTQPETVRQGLTASWLYQAAGYTWLGFAAAVFVIGAWAAVRKPLSAAVGWTSLGVVVVGMGAMTIYRDGIRDLTLLGKGFDVWQRAVETNWSVVGLFLGVLVAGLVALAWLLSVMARAKPVSERVG